MNVHIILCMYIIVLSYMMMPLHSNRSTT